MSYLDNLKQSLPGQAYQTNDSEVSIDTSKVILDLTRRCAFAVDNISKGDVLLTIPKAAIVDLNTAK